MDVAWMLVNFSKQKSSFPFPKVNPTGPYFIADLIEVSKFCSFFAADLLEPAGLPINCMTALEPIVYFVMI